MKEIAEGYFSEIRKILLARQGIAPLSVKVDGEYINFDDVLPKEENGNVLLPAKEIFSALGIFESNTCGFVTADELIDTFGCTVNKLVDLNCIDIYSPEEIIKSKIQETDGAIVTLADAENKTGGYKVYYGGCELQYVKNPENENDTVFYLKAGAAPDVPSWVYFWFETTGKFVPGRRYKVSFDVMHLETVDGRVPEKTTGGINFVYFDTAKTGESSDHGSAPNGRTGEFEVCPGKWSHIEYIYTIPKTIDKTKSSSLGIYSYPYEGKNAISYYLDDISVLPYEGELDDGLVD